MPETNCPNCGAPASHITHKRGFAVCDYCNTSFPLPKWYAQPEPDMGEVLLAADLRRKPIPGWSVSNEDHWELVPEPEAALRARFEVGNGVHYLLRSSGWFDDADAGVSIKFLDGKTDYIRAGLFVRYQDKRGGYGIFVSVQGTYMFGYYKLDEQDELTWETLMDWTSHTALRPGFGEPNRLRVRARGDRFQVYLNGVLASVFTDNLFSQGEVRIAVEPSRESNIDAVFSNLQVRAVPDEEE